MYQDNSNKTIKANEGNGILAVSDSLAFCVYRPCIVSVIAGGAGLFYLQIQL